MSLFKNPFGGNFVTNLAIGVGAAILTPFVVPLVARIVKPAAKNIVKGGILISEMFTGRDETTGDNAGSKTGAEAGAQNDAAPKASESKYAVVRPLAKSMIKGGIVAYERGKQVLSEAGENVRELVAVVKAEAAQAPAGAPKAKPLSGAVRKATAAPKKAKPMAAKKTVKNAPAAAPRKPAPARPVAAKKSTPKPKKEGG